MAVFLVNVANRDCVPYASKPYVRILGLVDRPDVDPEFVLTRCVERSSKGNIVWTSISTDASRGSPDSWVHWRAEVAAEVHMAAETRVMRPIAMVRATGLLQMFGDSDAGSAPGAAARPESRIVPEISHDKEIRGQAYALIAIMGDAETYKAKEALLTDLGTMYLDAIQAFTGLDSPKDAEEHFYMWSPDKREEALNTLKPAVTDTRNRLNILVSRPLVAFFDVSEDPEALQRKAADLAAWPELLHADIAVVRLYSWIALDKTYGSKHVTRSPMGQEFFDAMRKSQTS